jgi:hypothetical protein
MGRALLVQALFGTDGNPACGLCRPWADVALNGAGSAALVPSAVQPDGLCYLRFRFPHRSEDGSEIDVAQAFLTWNLALMLLNEGIIAVCDRSGWMTW